MSKFNSILVANCGTTTTSVALIDRADGHYRFVARGDSISTHVAPWNDVTVGVKHAIGSVERLLGRSLLTAGGELIQPQNPAGDGVDDFVILASAIAPLRVLVMGLMQDLSLNAAQRAVVGSSAILAGVLSQGEGLDPNRWWQHLLESRPDIVLIVGGIEGGATKAVTDLAQLAAIYAQLAASKEQPIVVYAGNSDAAGSVIAVLQKAGVDPLIVPNVLPALNVQNLEPVRKALDDICQRHRLTHVPGMNRLAGWTLAPIAGVPRSFGQVIRYVGERYDLNVVGVDVGSRSTVVAASSTGSDAESEDWSDEKKPVSAAIVHSDIGVGLGVPAALERIPIEKVLRWLPFELEADRAINQLLNKRFHPASVPGRQQDQLLEYAVIKIKTFKIRTKIFTF